MEFVVEIMGTVPVLYIIKGVNFLPLNFIYNILVHNLDLTNFCFPRDF